MIAYRTPETGDAQGLWNLMNQIDNETKYMLFEPGERREKAGNIAMTENMIKASQRGGGFLLMALDGGRPVGYISAQRGWLNRIAHSAHVVIGILEGYRNKGIGTELMGRLDAWAKENGISRLELTVICENGIAKRLYEKSGFVIEGTKRRAVLVDGIYLDEYYMAKITE